MRIINDPREPLGFRTSAAIGNFDGLHLGHGKIIDAVKRHAEESSMPSCAVTFDPHPLKILSGKEVSLIHPLEERFGLLEASGIDIVVCLSFTESFSKLSAGDFVKDILYGLIGIRHIVVGPGFVFGHARGGNVDLLRSMGESLGFETVVAGPARVDGLIVSSSLIRGRLGHGEVSEANRFFGYDYYVRGRVVEGEKRGRKLGFPTINIDTDWELLPKPGVYATYIELPDGFHGSITNIGVRPTFGENRLTVETHVFDFNGDLYGKDVRVNFVARIRDEKRFASVDELVRRIKLDILDVKRVLDSLPEDGRTWK